MRKKENHQAVEDTVLIEHQILRTKFKAPLTDLPLRIKGLQFETTNSK